MLLISIYISKNRSNNYEEKLWKSCTYCYSESGNSCYSTFLNSFVLFGKSYKSNITWWYKRREHLKSKMRQRWKTIILKFESFSNIYGIIYLKQCNVIKPRIIRIIFFMRNNLFNCTLLAWTVQIYGADNDYEVCRYPTVITVILIKIWNY